MNKLSIAVLIAGTAAVTGYVVSKMMKNKKKEAEKDIFDENYDDYCCEPCACEEDLDVVIPAEEAEDCAEKIEEAAEEVAEAAEDAVEEVKEAVEEAAEELKN